jgi:hypothetical protein
MHMRRSMAITVAAAVVALTLVIAPDTALARGHLERAALLPGRASAMAAVVVSHVAQARVLASAAVAAQTAAEAEAEAGYSAKTHAKIKAAAARKGDAARAKAILASLKARYPRYLSGVTVSMGNASGYQAVAYYTSGRIVISPKHKASLERILDHEVWHIIDWRDNGRIDWREKVPPANASAYR